MNFSTSLETNDRTSDENPYKYITIVIQVFLIILNVHIFYSIIWYERYGTDNKRTIVNKFVSGICWTGICWNLTVQVIIIIRFWLGPFNYYACFWYILSRRTLTTVGVMLMNAITIIRYIFIFWLKNPAIFNDDFWSRCQFHQHFMRAFLAYIFSPKSLIAERFSFVVFCAKF